jgi:molybdenum cofactor cytidylyltransferase
MEHYAVSIGIAILAAGGSSRMGQPKQLLPFQNKTLIEHVVSAATDSLCDPIVLVLGAYSERIIATIHVPARVHIEVNEQWQEGLASSLRAGVQALRRLDDCIDGMIVSLADQPFVSANIFDALISEFQQSAKLIVASRYSDAVGPPALFHRSLLDELLQTTGDKGARRIVEKYADQVRALEFSQGSVDLDTIDDYLALNAPGSSIS